MILVENLNIGDIPMLHLVQKENSHDHLPFVIFVHGFTSAKENNLHYAYFLAKRGFRVVLPEALYHGERQTKIDEKELKFHFWEVVLTTINELELIKEYFERENKIDSDRIGVAGTSMGGLVTLGALTKYSWIKAAVSLMGMPFYEKFALAQIDELKKHDVRLPLNENDLHVLLNQISEYDLSKQTEKLVNRPLLFWHGKQDKVVPFNYTYQFYENIKPMYENTPERLQFMVDEKADHKVSREGVLKTVEWFEHYLIRDKNDLSHFENKSLTI